MGTYSRAFGGKRRGRRLLTVVALIAASVTAPAALTGGTAAVAAPAPPGPATSLSDGFSRSPANLLQALACPVGKAVQHVTSTIPGVSTLTVDLANILCALKVLGYVYRTTYLPASGPPIVRYYRALVGVTAPLDVNGDGTTDFTSTVAPTLGTVAGIQMTTTRGPIGPTAKVSIEAFFLDPTSGTDFIGFGEDGTAAGTPNQYSAQVGAFLTSLPNVDLQLSLKSGGHQIPSTLSTIADVLLGANPDAPDSQIHGGLGFAPVPAKWTTRLRIGSSSQDVTVTSSVATKLTGSVNVIKPNDEKDVTVTVDKLSTLTDVIHQTSGSVETTTYTAGVVGHINGTYRDLDTQHNAIKVAAAIDLTSVPSQIVVTQVGQATSVTMASGVLGGVEARFATGQDVPPIGPGTGPYVTFHRYSSSRLAGGLRLTNIKSVGFDATGPYVGDIQFSPAPGNIPLSFIDDTHGVVATGHLSNLPAHITVTIDLDNGIVQYDGHGTAIHEIAVSATKSTPFFAKAKRLALTIDEIPASITVNFKQTNGTVSFTPSAPIGSVSLLASDGADAPAAVTGDYASYEDTPTLWRAFAQISSIGALSFTPPSADGTVPLSGTIKSGSSQKLTLLGHIQDASHDINITGSIDSIPSWIDFSLTKNGDGSQTIDYNSHGENVNTIVLDGTGLPLPLGADSAHVEIDHLPSHMSGIIPAKNGHAIFNPYGDHIDRVLVQVFKASSGPYNGDPSHQTAYADLADSLFTVDLHKIGYTDISTDSSNIYAKWDIASDPFDIEFWNDNLSKHFKATISNPEPASITQIQDPAGDSGFKLDYKADNSTEGQPGSNFTGDGSIQKITVETNVSGQYINATLQHIAPQVLICFDGTSMLCVPNWVESYEPGRIGTDAPTDASQIPPAFGFQLLPLTIDSQVHSDPSQDVLTPYGTRMRLDGYVCMDDAIGECLYSGVHENWVNITDLEFGTVEAGMGNRGHDCGGYCGQVAGYFNTNSTPISGEVDLYLSSTSVGSPFVQFTAPPGSDESNPDNAIEADHWYDRYHYDLPGSGDNHKYGTFTTVGNPRVYVNLGHHGCDVQLELVTESFNIC